MSLGLELYPHIPFLRRYARALTGSQSQGDAAVRRTLEAIVASPAAFPANIDVRWAFARGLARIDLKNDAKLEYERLINEPFLDPRGKAILQEEMEKL